MLLPTDLEGFAAQQSQALSSIERSLEGSARVALRHYGAAGWYSGLLNRVEHALRAHFRVKSGAPTSPALRIAIVEFRKHAEASLRKTKRPRLDEIDARAKALATSLATAAINAAVVAAGRTDGRPRLSKVWHSMEDAAVRPTHAAANGQKVPLARNFTVGGHPMSRPGDLRGPVEEWINCRCVLAIVDDTDVPLVAAAAAIHGLQMALLNQADTHGGAMLTETETLATEEIEEIEEAEPTPEEIGEVAPEMVPFYGVLAPEDTVSGDGRKFSPNALRWRTLPLPLAWQEQNLDGHGGSIVVANIEQIWRKNGLIYGSGHMLTTVPQVDQVVGMMAEGGLRGVSIDADDGTMQFEYEDGTPVSMDDDLSPEDRIVTVFTDARICGATLCSIPAFQEAFISLGETPADLLPEPSEEIAEEIDAQGNPTDSEIDQLSSDEGELIMSIDAETGEVLYDAEAEEFKDYDAEQRDKMAKDGRAMKDGSFPIADEDDLRNAIQAIGRAKDPEAAKAHIKKRAKALGKTDLVPEDWAAATFVKTEDGPGWLTHPVDTDRLRDYWTHGKGAGKIGWGTPGDFNRCRTFLAKYVKPQHLSGYCANRHYDALGFWPGDHARMVKAAAGETTAPALRMVITASGQYRPPSEWFSDPGLTGPSPIVVTEDLRIFGHLATWGVCHIGIPGACTTAPHSETDYAYFHTGAVLTDSGEEVAVGQITMATGHADLRASAKVAMAHYDNTGAAVADVVVGEDEFGIWVSGAVRPWVSEQQIHELRGAALSGDWRGIGESSELIAALAVNTPGFPIPRTALVASGGHQTALVATGIVRQRSVHTDEDVEQIVMRVLQREDARRRMAQIAAASGKDPVSRIKRLAAARERSL